MEIKTALEFDTVETKLLELVCKIRHFENRQQAIKIVRNLRTMIKKLSNFEIEERRSYSKNTSRTREQLLRINNEIESIEQWVTMLLLY
jgi:hypothetical protein